MNYRGYTLDPFQEQAIVALQRGETVLVCAPTGTGKTVVADWMVEDTLAQGQQVVYTAPIKALSNQKYRDYCKLLGPERVGLVTGDLVIRPDAPCRVMTTEILRNQLLQGQDLPDLGAVIVDEIHFLDDPERGTTWEELLIYLPDSIQVVGLSATLSNLDEFADWLRSVRGHKVAVIEEQQRAVPLHYLVATHEGGLLEPAQMRIFYDAWKKKAEQGGGRHGSRGHGRSRREPRLGHPTRHSDVFLCLVEERLPYLYFVQSRKDAEGMARSLGQRLDRKGNNLLSPDEEDQVVAAIEALQQTPGGENALDHELAFLYRHGVAFHHAGVHVMLKALVEELYERKLVKVLYCTGTFALGINMPARCAVFDKLERYNGREMIPLPAREFMQMAGRAGRRGMDKEGLVVVRTDIDAWPAVGRQLKRYLEGETEKVRSRFGLSLHSVVNLLERHTEAQVRTLVDRSFLAFHRLHRASSERRQATALAKRLLDQGWREGAPIPRSLKRDVQQLRRLKTHAVQRTDATWDELMAKVNWLEHWGYIRRPEGDAGETPTPSNWVLGAGANILRLIQFSEVFLTELVLEGVVGEVPMPELFGILCGMVNNLPRGVWTSEARRYKGVARRVSKVRHSDAVTSAEKVTGQDLTWDPEMIPFGLWWAQGQALSEIMDNIQAPTDISGELVSAFRRARDLLAQLRDVYRIHDPGRAEQIRDLLTSTRRDEVEVLD
ncbi:MAG: DEAD/DEAH box helicase [Oligoflexia bacterium]|nr:DEAD/DEAH box helicase [Oligoflexia bacterium]